MHDSDYQYIARRSNHARMLAGEVHPIHGKPSTYSYYMCRCDDCKQAKRKEDEIYQANKRIRLGEDRIESVRVEPIVIEVGRVVIAPRKKTMIDKIRFWKKVNA